MSKWRKKPVVIEARQLTRTNGGEIAQWSGGVLRGGPNGGSEGGSVLIHTLEGDHRADVGDWIIRGVKGEFYPCKPDIFAATYEPADAPSVDTNAERPMPTPIPREANDGIAGHCFDINGERWHPLGKCPNNGVHLTISGQCCWPADAPQEPTCAYVFVAGGSVTRGGRIGGTCGLPKSDVIHDPQTESARFAMLPAIELAHPFVESSVLPSKSEPPFIVMTECAICHKTHLRGENGLLAHIQRKHLRALVEFWKAGHAFAAPSDTKEPR